jgi:hypothetical protein
VLTNLRSNLVRKCSRFCMRGFLHFPNTIVYASLLRQSVDFGCREFEHTLFASLRLHLLAHEDELLFGKLRVALDFLQELLEFFVGD